MEMKEAAGIEKKVKKPNPGSGGKLSEAKIKLILLEDILLRAPAWGVVVLLVFGSMAFFFVWFTLNVLRPLLHP